jgi:hypothetical protein
MSNDQPTLLEGLLGDAFEHFGRAIPTVVSVKSVDGAGGKAAASYEMPFSWPKRVVDGSEELGSVVSEQLAAGPVLLVPPWGRRTDGRDQLSRNEHEVAILKCVPGGSDSLLAVLLPASTWVSRQSQRVREELAKRWRPVLVIYAAGVLPGIHSSFLLSAVFLRPKQAQQESLLRFFRVPARPDDSTVTEDFRRLLKRSGGRGQFGYVLRDMPSPGNSLAFDRHDPAVAARKAELSVLGTAVTVDEVFDLVGPGMHLSDDRDLLCDAAVPGASRIVSGRDLRRDGTLAPADESVKWALITPGQQLKAGDILLPRIFVPSDLGGLRAVEMADSDLPAAASDVVVTLRPRAPLTAPEHILILGFLRSQLARDLTAASADGMHLTWAALRELHIPQPDEALITALEDLAQAATRFEGWRSEAQALLESAFTDDSAAGTRARIVSSGRSIRLRSEAAALLDDAGYTFRTRLPFPLAYRWREVEAAVSARSFKTAYEAILAAAEVLLCYAANVGLGVARETGIDLGAVKMIHDKLQKGDNGLGFGDWTTVLNQIRDGKAVRNVPDGNPITELRALLADSGTEAAVQRLNHRRNDESHLRRAESPDLPAAVESSLADLTTLYRAASTLSDLPLIHVTAVRWDSFRELATVNYRELMGDHPVVPTRTITYDYPGIEVESLYVVDGHRRLCLLRPFMTGRACPKCRNWSTFHLDGSDDGKVIYKSLEHGHPIEDATLDDWFRHVGLL